MVSHDGRDRDGLLIVGREVVLPTEAGPTSDFYPIRRSEPVEPGRKTRPAFECKPFHRRQHVQSRGGQDEEFLMRRTTRKHTRAIVKRGGEGWVGTTDWGSTVYPYNIHDPVAPVYETCFSDMHLWICFTETKSDSYLKRWLIQCWVEWPGVRPRQAWKHTLC